MFATLETREEKFYCGISGRNASSRDREPSPYSNAIDSHHSHEPQLFQQT